MSNMNCPPTSRLHLTGIIFPVTGTVPPRIRQLRQHDHSEQHIPDAPIRASGLSGCHPDRYFPTLITVEHCPDVGGHFIIDTNGHEKSSLLARS
jgi:hypothetical protein